MASICGPLKFTSNFDSGNFQKVELLENRKPGGGHGIDYEVNLWTKPDCFGTPHENGNRTWFHFGIRGGQPFGNLKLNIINLNKQVKLFHQGMLPVFRILPGRPHWERIQDRLVVTESKDRNCSITFKQRLPEDPSKSTLYVAFTYPFSYAELREWLSRLDDIFMGPIPSELCFDRIKVPFPKAVEHTLATRVFPVEDEIYYCRECACYSLEGRTVDLITVTSMYGVSSEREERLLNLFPDSSFPRPFRFPHKKIVFVSARVHPGETPSTFVLNGFLKFVLERYDPRAILLRRLFVFKFMPMLNPDGVARGHYRTDPRGVNLNRVYLKPSPTLHPSIYAARKLLLYYHHGSDVSDDYEYPSEDWGLEPESEPDSALAPNKTSEIEDTSKISSKTDIGSSSAEIVLTEGSASKTPSLDSLGNNNGSQCSFTNAKEDKRAKALDVASSRETPQSELWQEFSKDLTCNDQAVSSATELLEVENDILSIEVEHLLFSKNNASVLQNVEDGACAEGSPHIFQACDDSVLQLRIKDGGASNDPDAKRPKTASALSMPNLLRRENEEPQCISILQANEASKKASTGKLDAEILGLNAKEKGFQSDRSAATRRHPCASSSPYDESPGGIFLYVDMHAHATKRGIFMYGNHFPDVATQTECMLFPKLMAMNCPHFDFPACNFTEKLMNVKDRRDGASRQGSGRVACFKLTNLIRSYTLECNYNTGRMVNPVISRATSYGFVDPPSTVNIHHAPKFTPDLFEGTGRALAESLLDLTGHNPWSRLCYTEFKTLEGVRRWISSRLQNSPEYNQIKVTNLYNNVSKDRPIPRKASSTTGSAVAPARPISRTSSVNINHPKKQSPKKRSNTKIVPEHHHSDRNRASPASKPGSETKVSPVGVSKTASTSSRKLSLPNKFNCYIQRNNGR